jgi:hypothetical protein
LIFGWHLRRQRFTAAPERLASTKNFTLILTIVNMSGSLASMAINVSLWAGRGVLS